MPGIDDFDVDEQKLLQVVPLAAGLAVGLADTDDDWYATGFANLDELDAVATSPARLASQYSANLLIAASLSADGIVAVLGRLGEAGLLKVIETGKTTVQYRMEGPADREHFIDEALAYCRRAVALIRSRDEVEQQEYRQWVYEIACAVAEASRTGGFLGFGGKQVSEAEAAMLSQLAAALDVSPGILETR